MKKVLFFLVILTTFYACKKNNGIVNYPIDADLKAAFNYQVGTYWIYRDSISGRIDSFAVTKNVFTPGSQTAATGGNYTLDGIEIYITEYNGGSKTDTTGWEWLLSTNSEELIWYSNIGFVGQVYFDFKPIFTYPFKIGEPVFIDGQYGNDTPTTTNIYSNYALNGVNFVNVAEIYNTYITFNNTNVVDWFYINSDIGYIKIRINDPYDAIHKVWEIQRWNINK